jgi:hypothetical protein
MVGACAPDSERTSMKKDKTSSQGAVSAAALIDARIKELGDWRGKTLARLRALIRKADPDIVEEWKWGGPVWSHDGVICTGESYKNAVKLTFMKGASVKDPSRLFNSSLDGNARRAIDVRENDEVDERAFQTLVRAAVALNVAREPAVATKPKAAAKKASRPKSRA